MKKIMTIVGMMMLGGMASASLTASYTKLQNTSSGNLISKTNLTVQAGDVVIFESASNKKTGVALATMSSTYAGSLVNLSPIALLGSPTATNQLASYLAYLAITNGGSYDFQISYSAAATANNGIYVLRAGSGVIQYLGTQAYVTNGGTATSYSTTINFADAANYGEYAYFSAVASQNITNLTSSGLNIGDVSVNKDRIYGSAIIADGNLTSYTATWSSAAPGATPNLQISSAMFTEVIPEPATIGMLGIGGLIIVGVRRYLSRA